LINYAIKYLLIEINRTQAEQKLVEQMVSKKLKITAECEQSNTNKRKLMPMDFLNMNHLRHKWRMSHQASNREER
jgi:hypothetical protein